MLNKELLMMGGGDSEATVVLRITHSTGDLSTVTMAVKYQPSVYRFSVAPSNSSLRDCRVYDKSTERYCNTGMGRHERFARYKSHTKQCNRRLQRRQLLWWKFQSIGQLCSRGLRRHLLTSQEALYA